MEVSFGLGLERVQCIPGIKNLLQHDIELTFHIVDPGVLSLIKGLHVGLLKHGRFDHVDIGVELVVAEGNVLVHQEPISDQVFFRNGASVTTDGGMETCEGLLLHCDPGGQCPDHGGQPDAGSRGHD